MTEAQIAEINRWLYRRPGVYCTRDETTVWKAALMASGVGCRLADFQAHCRRAGIDARPHGDGWLLDFTDGRALVALGVE